MKALMKILALSALVVIFGGIAASDAMAAIPEGSFLTVTEPLDVGGTVLQPGKYVIRVVDSMTSRNMLQVTNEDYSKVYATVLSIPHATPASEDQVNTEYVFYPASRQSPRALRTWFAPDSTSHGGHDIVYPQGRAMELAPLVKAPVVAYNDEAKPEELNTTELKVVTPEKTVIAYVEPKPVEKPVKVAVVRELPRTASQIPMFGFLGLLMIGAAVGVRAIRIA